MNSPCQPRPGQTRSHPAPKDALPHADRFPGELGTLKTFHHRIQLNFLPPGEKEEAEHGCAWGSPSQRAHILSHHE